METSPDLTTASLSLEGEPCLLSLELPQNVLIH